MLKTLPPLNNLVVIAPHPDDEAIGCASFFKNRQVTKLIVITDGSIQTIRRTMDNKKYISKRKEETLKFVTSFGINKKDVFFLDYRDGQLDKIDIKKLLSKINPLIKPEETILIPSVLDSHRDHRQVAKIAKFIKNKMIFYTITGNYGDSESVLRVKCNNKLLVKKYYVSQYWRLLKSNFSFRTYEEYQIS